jgi:hypothetical protein
MDALSRFGKTGRFQTQYCDDGIGVVQFKDVYPTFKGLWQRMGISL